MACLICKRRTNADLCTKHSRLYILDKENNWLRKKKRLPRGVSRRENNRRYHVNERKLKEILYLIYGKTKVVDGVHPLWAVSLKGALMEFDLCVPSLNLFIEYSGQQHFEYPNFFHRTKADFRAQQARDKLKAELAVEHGWNLLVVDFNIKVDYGVIVNILMRLGYVENNTDLFTDIDNVQHYEAK